MLQGKKTESYIRAMRYAYDDKLGLRASWGCEDDTFEEFCNQVEVAQFLNWIPSGPGMCGDVYFLLGDDLGESVILCVTKDKVIDCTYEKSYN